MKEGAVPAKAAREGSEIGRIDVDPWGDWAFRCAEGFKARIDYEDIECSKGGITQSRADGAKEVAQAWPNAEADEEVSLIRGIGAGIIGEKEAVEDRNEGSNLLRRSEDD